MISDTLHDAAEKIRDDLAKFPDAFAGDREEILDVLARMDRLRTKLDEPPARPQGRSIGWPGAYLGVDGKFY